MKKIKQLKWLLPILLQFCFAHANAQLNVGEYFFDTDPGVGNGIPITTQQVGAGPIYDSVTSTSSFPTPINMSPGVHTLYVRYGDFNNVDGRNWSNYEARKFTVNPPSGNGFAQAEYFFDTDPGLGNATSLPLNGNPDSSDFAGNLSTTGLTPGQHTLHIRCKTATGFWGNYETRKVIINVSNGSSIVEAEYFYDVDPGIGLGTSIALAGNTDSSSFAGSVSTTGLSLGIHQLCIRTKKANGEWGIYEIRKVKILSNGNALSKAEYFYDIDPGVGNGNAITLMHDGDSSSFANNIPTTGLTSGKHNLFVRTQDIEGKWSLYEKRQITIFDQPIIAEYFFDTDPGIGNGTQFAMTSPIGDTSSYAGGIVTDANLAYGNHLVYIRMQDAKGQWGHYDSLSLFINCKNPALPMVVQNTQTQCGDVGTLLTAVGNLNDASYWEWYSGSCGGTLIDTGNTIFLAPNDTTTYYVRGEGGCTNSLSCTDFVVTPKHNLEIKLFLQGYYTGSGQMTTALLNQNQATCDNVTDTILVELHDPITFALVDSKQAILHTNGIVKCDFSSLTGQYLLAIKHRNSIQTWSSDPIELGSSMANYDFSIAGSAAYLSNQAEIESNIWAIFSGDINQDGIVEISDYSPWESDANNFATGYLSTDLDGNGEVGISDYSIWEANANNFVAAATP